MNYTGMSPFQAFCCNGSIQVVSVLQMHRLNVEILACNSLRSRWLYMTQSMGLRLAAPLSDAVRPVLLNPF